MEEYDVLVLGCGEGGKYIAWNCAKLGQKVAVIERKYIGGSCPNIACLPSKNVIHSAKVSSLLSRSQEFGIIQNKTSIDMQAVRNRKRQMVDGLIKMHLDLFQKSGAELIVGNGIFVDPKIIEVTNDQGITRTLSSKKIVLSTGSREAIENIPGMQKAQPLTHVELLELDHLPNHLLIIGGGYIGLELAQAMGRFGSQVTIIERNDRLAHREDRDVSEALQNLFKEEGINFIPTAKVVRVEGVSGQRIILHLLKEEFEQTIEGTDLLIATGRSPNTSNIGLEIAGVELMHDGHIKVNERLETTALDIWAVGDCCGSPHFTHIAFDDFRIVFENMNGGNRVKSGRQVPYCMFTDPELARVGLNETEANAQGIPYRLAKIPMSMVLRTRTLSETQGFMKALIDTKTDRILGITIFGVGAGEVIATVQIAMLAELPYTVLKNAIFAHPTLTEGLIPLFSSVPQRAEI
jgi:pyruvate/2-oxoglutarate dehydrogenase complex dihydrolipoamide dehydrogenase (E3) component